MVSIIVCYFLIDLIGRKQLLIVGSSIISLLLISLSFMKFFVSNPKSRLMSEFFCIIMYLFFAVYKLAINPVVWIIIRFIYIWEILPPIAFFCISIFEYLFIGIYSSLYIIWYHFKHGLPFHSDLYFYILFSISSLIVTLLAFINFNL